MSKCVDSGVGLWVVCEDAVWRFAVWGYHSPPCYFLFLRVQNNVVSLLLIGLYFGFFGGFKTALLSKLAKLEPFSIESAPIFFFRFGFRRRRSDQLHCGLRLIEAVIND